MAGADRDADSVAPELAYVKTRQLFLYAQNIDNRDRQERIADGVKTEQHHRVGNAGYFAAETEKCRIDQFQQLGCNGLVQFNHPGQLLGGRFNIFQHLIDLDGNAWQGGQLPGFVKPFGKGLR